jgi:hypothetical protein
MPYSIIPNNTVSIWNGEDEVYHIVPSGYENHYLVVGGGVHSCGTIQHMSKEMILEKYGLEISQKDV